MGRCIVVSNQKGGVGKTTTAINLGAALAEAGHRVLLIDLDPRADLSAYLGVYLGDGQGTVYDSLFVEGVALADVVVANPAGGFDVAPATADLAGAEMLLMGEFASRRQSVVREAIKPLSRRYDYVLMDTPPGLQLLSVAAMLAADEIIVPQQCSFLALHGLRQLQENIDRMRTQLNADLRICGIVMTMQDRRTIHNRQVIDMVRAGFGELVFDTIIPTAIRFQEAVAAQQPIIAYDPESGGAEAYRRLAEEVVARGS